MRPDCGGISVEEKLPVKEKVAGAIPARCAMGMFDTLVGDIICPWCDAKVDSLQTKDYERCLRSITIIPDGAPHDATLIEAHGECQRCHNWISMYYRISVKVYGPALLQQHSSE